MEVVDVGIFWRGGKFQAGVVLEQDRQRNLQFQPRQRRADAEMQAAAEGMVRSLGESASRKH